MSLNKSNLLIDHLDKVLEGSKLNEAEELILTDAAIAKEWQVIQFTASSIREAGLYQQVGEVRNQYTTEKKVISLPNSNRGVVRTMTQKMMRVAAVLLFVTTSATLYKYISVNDSSVYENYYSSYELQTSRSAGNGEGLDNAYRDNKWNEVLSIVNGIQDKTSKHFFLAGMANLELKQYEQAIQSFESVINENRSTGDDYFGEETDYYLAMSYLANKEGDKALPILEKIKKDKSHLYNQAVSKMGLDFRILKIKERK